MSPQEVLAQADWLRSSGVQRVFELLDGAHGKTQAVGGAVRDTLLGVAVGDIDFATVLLPDEVMARAKAADIQAIPTGIDHGTLTLVVDGRGFEVTTLRQDIATDGRHAEVQFGTDWSADAARRDFTLNALYADMDGQLFDPLGGLDDALAGRVRFIGDADTRIAEDRLRVFRFFRFSASHGGEVLDAEGLAACARAAGDLADLSAERVGNEMTRMLGLPTVAKTLTVMQESGVWQAGAEWLADLADYELRIHAPDGAARLALMFEHQNPRDVQKRWRLSNADLKAAQSVQAAAHLLSEGAALEAAYRHGDVLRRALPVAGVLGEWDAKLQTRIAAQLASIEVPDFPISGDDLLERGVEAGPLLGDHLNMLEGMWIESGFKLNRDQLLMLIG